MSGDVAQLAMPDNQPRPTSVLVQRYPVIRSSKIKLDHFSSSPATERPTMAGKIRASSHICDAVK